MRRSLLRRVFHASLSLLFIALSWFPLVYAVSTSFKQGSALFEPGLWPEPMTLDNYRALFREQPFAHNLLNSFLVAAGTVILSLGLSLLAAWSLGRTAFRGRGLLLGTILGASMFPQVAVLSGM